MALFWSCSPHSSFQRLSSASEGMTLNATTLRNLEILNNQVKVRLACQLTVSDRQKNEVRPVRVIDGVHRF